MDRRAVEALFRTHAKTVTKCCFRILRDRDEVADAVQDVFVKLLIARPAAREIENWDAYLARVSTRTCLNRLRDSRRRHELIEQHGGALVRTPPDTGETVGARQLLQLILGFENEQTRDIVYYYYQDGMSQQEIGLVLGMSGSAVGKHLRNFNDGWRPGVNGWPDDLRARRGHPPELAGAIAATARRGRRAARPSRHV